MRSFCAAVAVIAALLAPAMARAGHSDPGRYEDDLQKRRFQRKLEYREAQRHPMTWQQEQRLRENLDRRATNDQREREQFYRNLDKKMAASYKPSGQPQYGQPQYGQPQYGRPEAAGPEVVQPEIIYGENPYYQGPAPQGFEGRRGTSF